MTLGQPFEPRPQPASLFQRRVTPAMALLIVGAIAVLRLWVVETAIVDGSSMADTLQPNDRVLILKVLKPQRLDLIVFRDPQIGGRDIKRIVGLPGDVVSIVPHVDLSLGRESVYGGQLYVNAQPYAEPYATSILPTLAPPTAVPPESFFVLGDNRDDSTDSRSYGPIGAGQVRGVAVAVVFPFSRIRLLERGESHAPRAAAAIPH